MIGEKSLSELKELELEIKRDPSTADQPNYWAVVLQEIKQKMHTLRVESIVEAWLKSQSLKITQLGLTIRNIESEIVTPFAALKTNKI